MRKLCSPNLGVVLVYNVGFHLFDRLLQLCTGHFPDVAAAQTAKPEIHSGPKDFTAVASAGMVLFQAQLIAGR